MLCVSHTTILTIGVSMSRARNFGIQEAGQLLRLVRSLAGFPSAKAAAINYGWSEPSLRAHESGTRRIGPQDAEKYASAFDVSAAAFRSGDAAMVEIERLRSSPPHFEAETAAEKSSGRTGARLKLARKVRGFASAFDLSAAYGFVLPTLASHEAGNNPIKERMAEAYAEALGVSASWLTRGELPSGLGEEADRQIGAASSLAEIDSAYLARIADPAPSSNRDKVNLLLGAAKARRAPGSSDEDEIYEVEAATIVQTVASARRLRTWKLPKGLVQTLFNAAAADTVILAIEQPIEGMAQGDRVFIDTSRRDPKADGEFVFYSADGRVFLGRNSGPSASSGNVLIGCVVARLMKEKS
jgi:hypothetical protein